MGVRILKGGMLTTVQDSLEEQDIRVKDSAYPELWTFVLLKLQTSYWTTRKMKQSSNLLLMGPTLEFTSETIISITGGDFQPTGQWKACRRCIQQFICIVEIS